jgi:wyosine [tRNA(Phe)-imidazoG37] synthetase (radical SAM superfamily)
VNHSGSYRYLFGPVPSRRLGLSLGVDCVPVKTCTLDCVYCECGATTSLSLTPSEYVPAREIIAELDAFLSTAPKLDVITFTGSGEPTLNTALAEIIRHCRQHYPQYITALLTNSTLLHLPAIRKGILAFDYILPSLDAVSQPVFEKINRPASGLRAQQVVDGLITLSQEYRGILWVEVFIIPGINNTPDELKLLKDILTVINPQRVQLNALDRPGTCAWVTQTSSAELERIAALFQPLPVEILSRAMAPRRIGTTDDPCLASILDALRRRPATIEDLATVAGTTINTAQQLAERLLMDHQIHTELVGKHLFYRVS